MEEVGIRRLTGFGVMPGSLLSSADDCEGRLELPGTARGQLDNVVFKAG